MPKLLNSISLYKEGAYGTLFRPKPADRVATQDRLTGSKVVRSSEAGKEPQIAASGKNARVPECQTRR